MAGYSEIKYADSFFYLISSKEIEERIESQSRHRDIENDSIRDKFLEKEELNEFLTTAKNEGLEGDLLTFTLLAYTGSRIGEIITLKWSDIDFNIIH